MKDEEKPFYAGVGTVALCVICFFSLVLHENGLNGIWSIVKVSVTGLFLVLLVILSIFIFSVVAMWVGYFICRIFNKIIK